MKPNKFYLSIQLVRHESPVVAININPSCHRGADEKWPPRGAWDREEWYRCTDIPEIDPRRASTKGEDYAINSD